LIFGEIYCFGRSFRLDVDNNIWGYSSQLCNINHLISTDYCICFQNCNALSTFVKIMPLNSQVMVSCDCCKWKMTVEDERAFLTFRNSPELHFGKQYFDVQ